MTRSAVLALCLAAGALPVSTAGAEVIHPVSAAATSSALHGGNRELIGLGFAGSPTVIHGSAMLAFSSGSISNNLGTFGWTTPIPRDLGPSNNVSGNPDRADSATPFPAEGAGTGTLAQVFGPFGPGGYKNLSYIIDGEDRGSWTMDLMLAPGQSVSADADPLTVEIAVLERGMNSDFLVRGIRADRGVTDAIFVARSQTGAAGWTLNTLEIEDTQPVGGVGISLDPSWTDLIGVQIEAVGGENGFNGPDPVAVALVPGPGTAALLALAGVVGVRRRRN